MRLIDTHAHLDFREFDIDRANLISLLRREQIGVINPSSDLESNRSVDLLTKQSPLIWGALGLHPTEISDVTLNNLPAYINEWRKLFEKNSRLVAVGEIGLDYYRNRESASNQKAALKQMITFAKEIDKPIIFHCREAFGDLVTLIGDYLPIKGVMHCFSGNLEQARQVLELGLMISFTANITYPKNQMLEEVIKDISLEKILLETDSPFLASQHNRGQRNDPKAVKEVAEKIAKLKGLTIKEVENVTTDSAVNFFDLN